MSHVLFISPSFAANKLARDQLLEQGFRVFVIAVLGLEPVPIHVWLKMTGVEL